MTPWNYGSGFAHHRTHKYSGRHSKILNIIHGKEANEIVVGLPKHMNNTLGEKAQAVLAFVDLLKKHVTIPVNTIDERLSTVRAHKAMLEGDLSRKKAKRPS